MRAHRRAIVNLEAVSEVRPLFQGGYEVRLRSGEVVRVGRTHRDRFLQALGG